MGGAGSFGLGAVCAETLATDPGGVARPPEVTRPVGGLRRPGYGPASARATRSGWSRRTDTGDSFFVIEHGHVEVFEQDLHRRVEGPGEHFGGIALLRDV